MDVETLLAMKECSIRAQRVVEELRSNERASLNQKVAMRDFAAVATAANVSALIAERNELAAEVERQAGEIAMLKQDRDSWRRTVKRLEGERVGIKRVV